MIARYVEPQSKPTITILDAVDDDHLFAPFFKDQNSWTAWRVFLKVLFGLSLDDDQLTLFRQCTGRNEPLPTGHNEAWLVCGRRGGKSFTLALIAVYLACFKDFKPFLAAGERATLMVVAADRKQAKTILRYAKGLLQSVPMLAKLILSDTAEAITLRNRVVLEVHTSSFRTVRGYTIVAALLDELAFWPSDDSAEPDHEVINALRPGQATIPGAMLLCASSPYARRGELWNAHRKHFGKDGDPILVWQAPTRVMNPSVPESFITEAMERDPASAAAEYMAQFRTDIESFVNREAVESCIVRGIFERAPQTGVRYHAFVDPSGGSADSMTLCIAHKDRDCCVIDCVRERKPPFSPEAVVIEFAHLLRSYRISKLTGDRFGGEFVREPFKKFDITYDLSDKLKSALYQFLLPVINSQRVQLLDHPRLFNQLISLERRTARGGKDSIDHPPNQHDDVGNAVAGAVDAVIGKRSYDSSLVWVNGADDKDDVMRRSQALALQQHLMQGIHRWR